MTINKKPKIEYSEYDKQADAFMKKTGSTLSVIFKEYGQYFPDDKNKRDIYSIMLWKGGRAYNFTFGQSEANSARFRLWSSNGVIVANDHTTLNKLAKRQVALGECHVNDKQREPSAYDILSCLQKNDPGTFKDFCSEFGYSDDSIKSHDTYQKVKAEYEGLARLYSDDELEQMMEIQ